MRRPQGPASSLRCSRASPSLAESGRWREASCTRAPGSESRFWLLPAGAEHLQGPPCSSLSALCRDQTSSGPSLPIIRSLALSLDPLQLAGQAGSCSNTASSPAIPVPQAGRGGSPCPRSAPGQRGFSHNLSPAFATAFLVRLGEP